MTCPFLSWLCAICCQQIKTWDSALNSDLNLIEEKNGCVEKVMISGQKWKNFNKDDFSEEFSVGTKIHDRLNWLTPLLSCF